MTLQKNDNIELRVDSLGYKGEGVARSGDTPVFISGALPSEKVRAHVILVKKDFAVAKLTDVLEKSADRVTPQCKYFGKCGGCDLQHLSYEKALAYKKQAVADALHKIARFDFPVADCVPSDLQYGYRNKLSLPVRRGVCGAEVGLFAENSHRIVGIDDCPLQSDLTRAVLPSLKKLATYFAPYDEDGRGELRHFVVRSLGDKLSLTAVMTKNLSDRLLSAVREVGVKCDELWLNVNKKNDNVILGDETHFLGGNGVQASVLGLSVTVHPKAFLQVNDGVSEKLYSAVLDTAKAIGAKTIIDAYSGCGTLTALLSRVGDVVGVEIEKTATAAADELMKREGITNVRNVCGDCALVLPDIIGRVGKNALVVLDPPRTGCDRKVIDALVASGVEHVLYVSCNPATLARDLSYLTAYVPQSITPFDMFPMTRHVETFCVLRKKFHGEINS